MSAVLISYRSEDTRPWAITLRDHLARTVGDRQVFLDVDSLQSGPWRMQIDRTLQRCAVVVVLIGPRWTAATDAEGRKRLFLSDDVHHLEVVTALGRPDVTVIPVLVDGARLPSRAELPEDLHRLLECQVSEIADTRDLRVASLHRLTRIIDDLLGHRRHRRHALLAVFATTAAGVVNTLVASNSRIAGAAFLIAAFVLNAWSLVIYRRMNRAHMKGSWVALVAVLLSAALVAGSIARLAVPMTQATRLSRGVTG